MKSVALRDEHGAPIGPLGPSRGCVSRDEVRGCTVRFAGEGIRRVCRPPMQSEVHLGWLLRGWDGTIGCSRWVPTSGASTPLQDPARAAQRRCSQNCFRGTADTDCEIDPRSGTGSRDRRRHVTVGEQFDPGADSADLLDEIRVPRRSRSGVSGVVDHEVSVTWRMISTGGLHHTVTACASHEELDTESQRPDMHGQLGIAIWLSRSGGTAVGCANRNPRTPTRA